MVIGNKEISNKYIQSIQSYNSNMYSIPVNDHGVKHNDRKVGLHMSGSYTKDNLNQYGISRYFVYANFTAQKKNLFGWVRYSTIYNAIFNLGSFYTRAADPKGYSQDILVNGTFYVNTPYTDRVQILTGEQSGNWTMCLGYTNTGSLCKGDVKFWSRGVAEENAGYMNVYIDFFK